jgi:hypothetical protein
MEVYYYIAYIYKASSFVTIYRMCNKLSNYFLISFTIIMKYIKARPAFTVFLFIKLFFSITHCLRKNSKDNVCKFCFYHVLQWSTSLNIEKINDMWLHLTKGGGILDISNVGIPAFLAQLAIRPRELLPSLGVRFCRLLIFHILIFSS